ncbi:hypothetical protein [Paenibacillus sp. FSL R7-0652]
MKQAMSLWDIPAVQEQSRRVDELVARVNETKANHSRVVQQ